MITYLFLFLISFFAATIFPFSSELTLVGLLSIKSYSPLALVGIASFGNILGSVFNWYLGFYLLKYINKNGFPLKNIRLSLPQNTLTNLVLGCCYLLGLQS